MNGRLLAGLGSSRKAISMVRWIQTRPSQWVVGFFFFLSFFFFYSDTSMLWYPFWIIVPTRTWETSENKKGHARTWAQGLVLIDKKKWWHVVLLSNIYKLRTMTHITTLTVSGLVRKHVHARGHMHTQTLCMVLSFHCDTHTHAHTHNPGQKKTAVWLCIKSEHCSYHAISRDWHGGAAGRDFVHRCTEAQSSLILRYPTIRTVFWFYA